MYMPLMQDQGPADHLTQGRQGPSLLEFFIRPPPSPSNTFPETKLGGRWDASRAMANGLRSPISTVKQGDPRRDAPGRRSRRCRTVAGAARASPRRVGTFRRTPCRDAL
ncbi:unnamed protein product [Urochloa humidicola]